MKNLITLFLAASVGVNLLAQGFKKVTSNVNTDLFCLNFTSDSFGFIGTENGSYLKSKDNGKSWEKINVNWIAFDNPKSFDVSDIQFLNKDTGYLILDDTANGNINNKLLYTQNGGASWYNADKWNVGATVPSKLFLANAKNGFIAGSGFFSGNNIVKISDDTVVSEQFMHSNDEFAISCFARHSIDSDFLMMAAEDGNIYYSLDHGVVWAETLSNFNHSLFDGKRINDIIHLNNQWVIAVDSNTSLFFSNDTGRTWNPQLTTFSYPKHNAMTSVNQDTWMTVGVANFGNGEITTFKGSTMARNEYVDEGLNDIQKNIIGEIFIIGQNGSIYSNAKKVSVSKSLKKNQVLKIWPNPSNGVFDVNMKGNYHLTVFNNSGGLIVECLMKSNRICLDSLPKGIYYLTIESNRVTFAEKLMIK